MKIALGILIGLGLAVSGTALAKGTIQNVFSTTDGNSIGGINIQRVHDSGKNVDCYVVTKVSSQSSIALSCVK